jgi:predicted transcriptional regulator
LKYRSRTDIISQILDAANGGGTTKTQIMYKSCLNYNKLKECLAVLTESGLLSYDVQTVTFKTTEKGLRFLKNYNQIVHLMYAPEIGYGSNENFRQPFVHNNTN